MMRRLALVLAVALVGSLAGGPASSAVREIEVRNNFFSPASQSAEPGDTLRWVWNSGGVTHNVVSYSGQSINSGNRTSGSFEVTYNGGPILYRCTIHSSTPGGGCSGMCGEIVEAAPPPPPPTITSPTSGQTFDDGGVTVTGTASSDTTRIRVKRAGTVLADFAIAGTSWSRQVSFANGSHTIHATALNAGGAESAASGSVTFTVEDTTPPPPPAITQPADGAVRTSPGVTVAGTASTDTVSVRVRRAGTVVATLGASGGSWSGSVNFVNGQHTITATALDAAGNESGPSNSVSFLVDYIAPTVFMVAPSDNSVNVQPFVAHGTAIDNLAVAEVVVSFQNLVTLTATEMVASSDAYGSTSLTWEVEVTGLLPGAYRISAVAEDLAGNRSPAHIRTIIVL